MKKVIMISVLVIVAVAAAFHLYMADRGRWTTDPDYTNLARRVVNNELISEQDPNIVMRFDQTYRHLGGQKFILYGVADTEQHFFIETTPDDRLKSLYWVQFEAYLPDNSHQYDYEDSPLRLSLKNYEFYTDTDAVQTDPNKKRRRGTDGALARAFLQSKGYTYPANFLYARLVYLTDATKRKELMIIFIDDLAPLGLTGSDLSKDGNDAGRWPEIEHSFLDKIYHTMTLFPAEIQ